MTIDGSIIGTTAGQVQEGEVAGNLLFDFKPVFFLHSLKKSLSSSDAAEMLMEQWQVALLCAG